MPNKKVDSTAILAMLSFVTTEHTNMKTEILIITNTRGEFLRHEGHKHHWTKDRSLAMEYSKRDVAEDLAKLHGGKVETL